MAKLLESFPIIVDEAINIIRPEVKLSLSYDNNGTIKDLPITHIPDTDYNYYIDNNGEWNPSKNNLKIRGNINLFNLNTLFNEYKVADVCTTLGVGINFICKTSKMNITKPIGEFDYGDDILSLNFDLDIDKQKLSQKVDIEVFVYVKSVLNKTIFASVEGVELGQLCNITMDIEGSGSIFPIKIIEDSSKPLWSMNLNYDTLDDSFSIQTVCIKINKAHKDFKYLGCEDIDSNNYYLWKEILSNFFVNILLSAKEEYDSLSNNLYEDGTVGCFIAYLIDSFKIEKNYMDNPIMLSENIRLILDKIIK